MYSQFMNFRLNKLMEKIKGKPEEGSIERFAIKSMSKAKYSTKKEKHFGLAFPNYTHFTSPIRRFPDVMVHRLLYKYLNFSKSVDKTYYEILCKHSSKMEINATKAERESIKFKQTEYMTNFINQKFEAVLTAANDSDILLEWKAREPHFMHQKKKPLKVACEKLETLPEKDQKKYNSTFQEW